MLTYLTGPSEFNIGMRSTARKLGYKLNQKSLIDMSTGTEIQLPNEESIFQLLGCSYINPEDRSNWYCNYKVNKL